MTEALAHRGPDGQGVYVNGVCGLGHRRLAIIDLSDAARQPMCDRSGRFTITYNGEAYNFRQLRSELELVGHRFRSESDTEVVLAAWIEWGSESLTRFNGMFAFAVWDSVENTLTLARDRYGIKPLYYAQVGLELAFGSEIKALIAHPKFETKLDLEGLLEYFTFQNFFTDRTLFQGVHLLPAGCYLSITNSQWAQQTVKRYWDFGFQEPKDSHSDAEYLEELDRLFREAVKHHLVADVEVGTYLSGGLDSSSVTAIAATHLPHMKTFTCGFDLSSASGLELAFDERSAAERLSYKCKTEHYEMVLKAGDMERVMPRLTWHLEEPRVGQSYPNFFIAQLASKFVKVSLAGTGGDELFGGYPWRYYRAVVNNNFDDYVDKYYAYWQRLLPNSAIRPLFAPIWGDVKHVWTRDIFRDVFSKHAIDLSRPEDYVNHSLYFEAKTFLHGLLVMEDKLSMAHGLETRLPFLDNDLADFAMRLPARLKLGNLAEVIRLDENEPGPKTKKYFSRTKDGKLLLRRVMERHVPADVTERDKQGFSGPDASWFRGESIDYVRRRLLNKGAKIYAYMDRTAAQRLIDDHLHGIHNRRLLIWSLLYVESWCDNFLPS